MDVILLQNIKGLGKIGEVKKVSDGHARNFLLPKKMAKLATASALKEVASLTAKQEAMDIRDKENAQRAVAVLASITLEFHKKSSPTGTLFSSVTKQEIAAELTKHTKLDIHADMLDLGAHGEHIKHIGEHAITLDLDYGLKPEVKISVKSGS
jgi:large subunit ribosomal protein L9